MKSIFTRRDFLLAASSAALAACVNGQSPASKASFPYVDGLCLDLPDDTLIRASGLSAYLLDASAVDEVKTPDGTSKWRRNYGETLKSVAAIRQRLRSSQSAFLATNGSDITRAFKEAKTAVFLQVQGGGEIVETDLDRINV